jgi:hypothetical protein
MKIITKIAVSTTLFSCFSAIGFAGDLELAIAQLNKGQFKQAIAEFKPLLIEQYAPAQYQMGLVHLNGWGVKKDTNKAFDLLTLAAAQNYPDALFSLSLIYDEGVLVDKNAKKAFGLMEKAANKKLASAQFNLGVMYANGKGTVLDSSKAVRWYEKAARQNYALAQFNLALMYFEGKGIKKDLEMSYIWNYISSKSGYEPARKSRDMDENKLSIEQLKSARERAENLYSQILIQIDLRNKKLMDSSF